MLIFSLRGCVIPLRTSWYKRECLCVHLYQKDPKYVKKWLSYGHFLPESLHDSIGNFKDERESFWVHRYQKDPKSATKRLNYGHFLPERLGDSIEKHMG